MRASRTYLRHLIPALLVVAAFLLTDLMQASATQLAAATYGSSDYVYDEPADVAPMRAGIRAVTGNQRPSDSMGVLLVSRPVGHHYDDGADLVAPRVTDDLVDLVSPSRRHHILDGEVRPNGTYGGGHRAGTGYPGKSEFPARWSDEQIMHHVSDIATDPLSTTVRTQGRDVFVAGTRDGIDIEVLIRNGEIWTAYPTNVPRNPR